MSFSENNFAKISSVLTTLILMMLKFLSCWAMTKLFLIRPVEIMPKIESCFKVKCILSALVNFNPAKFFFVAQTLSILLNKIYRLINKSDLPLILTVLNNVFSIKNLDFNNMIMLSPENTPPSPPPIPPKPNCAAHEDKFPPPVPFSSKAKLSLAV